MYCSLLCETFFIDLGFLNNSYFDYKNWSDRKTSLFRPLTCSLVIRVADWVFCNIFSLLLSHCCQGDKSADWTFDSTWKVFFIFYSQLHNRMHKLLSPLRHKAFLYPAWRHRSHDVMQQSIGADSVFVLNVCKKKKSLVMFCDSSVFI